MIELKIIGYYKGAPIQEGDGLPEGVWMKQSEIGFIPATEADIVWAEMFCIQRCLYCEQEMPFDVNHQGPGGHHCAEMQRAESKQIRTRASKSAR